MADVRVKFEGLIAFGIEDKDASPDFVTRIFAIFGDPWRHGLHPHAPRLVVPDARTVDWGKTTASPMPGVSPLSFDLSGSHVAMLPDDKAAPIVKVATPMAEEIDPLGSGQRVLSNLTRLLDLKTICGNGALKAGYCAPPLEADLLGRLVIDFGKAQTMSSDSGNFDEWRFLELGQPDITQAASDFLIWRAQVQASLTFSLRSLATPNTCTHIRITCDVSHPTQLEVRHTCDDETNCGPHRGANVPVFYEMVRSTTRRPAARAPSTDGGYCPPGRFSK